MDVLLALPARLLIPTMLLAATALPGCIVVSRDAYDRDMAGMRRQTDWLEAQKKALATERDGWKGKHKSAAANAQQCQRKQAELEAQLKDKQEKMNALARNCGKAGELLAKCEQQLQIARGEVSIEHDKFNKCSARLDAANARLDALKESIASVRRRLAALIKAGKLSVVVRDGFLVIQLQSDILFSSGKAVLKDAAKPVLLELAAVFKQFEGRRFQVAGHTDSTGTDAINWPLSTQRALAVVQFLIAKGAVKPQMLSAGGYASYLPVARNDTDEGRQQNRRVEFLLLPDLSELLELAGVKKG